MALSTHDKMMQIPYAIRRRGGNVFVVDKWGSRGASGLPMASRVYGMILHWIVSTLKGSKSIYQTLSLIINGHSTLPGPLANFYIAFNGDIGCVAAGRANHGGVGIHRGVSGNQFFTGTEAEGPPFFKEQIEAYAILLAAHYDVFGFHPKDWAIGHDEYATPRGRKQDIGAYINEIRAKAIYLVDNKIFPGDAVEEVPEEEENEMISRLMRADGSPDVYLVQGNTRTHVKDEDRLKDIRHLNSEAPFLEPDDSVRVVSPEVLDLFQDVTRRD